MKISLTGFKTYLTGIVAILAALMAFINGAITVEALWAAILAAIQTMNIRHAMTTTATKIIEKKK